MNSFDTSFARINNKIESLVNLEPSSEVYKKDVFEVRMFLFTAFDFLTEISVDIKLKIFNFFEQYPHIYADVVSASESANCSCRGRVANFLQENSKDMTVFFEQLLKDFPQADSFYEQIWNRIEASKTRNSAEIQNENQQLQKSLVGRVLSVKNSQEYHDTLRGLSVQGFKYNGLNVVEKDAEIRIYFY